MLDIIPLGYKIKHRIKYGTDIVYSIQEGDKTNSINNMANDKTPTPEVKTTVLNAQVKTAKVTQSGNEELGLKEKNLYYLVIITDKGKMQINVGEKTHDDVKKLTEK